MYKRQVVNRSKIVYNGYAQDLGGLYPVVAYAHDPIVNTFSGHSIVDSLKGVQDFVNILLATIAKNVMLRGGYNWLAEPGAIKQRDWSQLRPDTVIPVGAGALSQGKLQEMTPGPLGKEVIDLLNQEVAYSGELGGDPSGVLAGVVNASISSGEHQKTLLETSNTQVSAYIGQLDAGHEQAAYIEALMMQQNLDFSDPYYAKRYATNTIPFIDKAISLLDFVVEVLSKKNLPSTTISGEFNYLMTLYSLGILNIEDLSESIEMQDKMKPHWIEELKAVAKEAVPGVPPQLVAQLKVEREGQAQDLLGQVNQLEQQNAQQAQLPPGVDNEQ